ncbi:MAG: iron-containing alcohol dehydrogenase [Pseudomonadota bacterium]
MAAGRSGNDGILEAVALDKAFNVTVPTAIRFGCGVSAEIVPALPDRTRRVALLRGTRALAADGVRDALARGNVSHREVICSGEPSVATVNDAVGQLAHDNIDAVISVGGGSVIDTGKAVAFCLGHKRSLSKGLSDEPASLLSRPGPTVCIAIPTTAGTGAEVTANAVLDIPERHAKVSLRGRALFPTAAFVDPDLLKSAPTSVLLASGMDAIVQTIEAYTSNAATPFSDALTALNIPLGIRALQHILAGDPPALAWQDLAWTSLTSGIALANGGLGAAHGIASIIGGRYAAPHGALCGRLLVPVLRQNIKSAASDSAAQKLRQCAAHLSEAFPPAPDTELFSGFEAWQERQGLARLKDYGVRADDLPSIAQDSASASSSRKNAVSLKPDEFLDILKDAL